MKSSELIAALEAIKAEHGDLPVAIWQLSSLHHAYLYESLAECRATVVPLYESLDYEAGAQIVKLY